MLQRKRFSDGSVRVVVLFILAFILSIIIPNGAFAYDRKVLAEIFTSTFCPICPRYIPPVQDMLEEDFEDDQFIIVQYHTWWVGDDPWYIENYERHLPGVDDIRTRISWMDRDQYMGVPSFFFDGQRIEYGNDLVDNAREYVAQQIEDASPLEIELRARTCDGVLYSGVSITSEERLSNLNLFLALCEREVNYNAPSGQRRFSGNVLDLFPTAEGERFSIVQDYVYEFECESEIDIGWHENELDNLMLVAWVQNLDFEILQSQSASIRLIEAPEAFNLTNPRDEFEVDRNRYDVTFTWEEPENAEREDITYILNFEVLNQYIDPIYIEDIEECEYSVGIDRLMHENDVGRHGEELEVDVEWWVEAVNDVVTTESEERWMFTVPVPPLSAGAGDLNLPYGFALGSTYPNPFNGQATVPFSIDSDGQTRLILYDITGRNAVELLNGKLSAGSHTVSLNADQLGLVGGIYYLKLGHGGRISLQKVVYLR